MSQKYLDEKNSKNDELKKKYDRLLDFVKVNARLDVDSDQLHEWNKSIYRFDNLTAFNILENRLILREIGEYE